MSKFGDLIAGVTGETVEKAPVVETPVVETPTVIEESPVEEPKVSKKDIGDVDYHSMNKEDLEEFGRLIGIELDRRHNKNKLIKQLENYIDGL